MGIHAVQTIRPFGRTIDIVFQCDCFQFWGQCRLLGQIQEFLKGVHGSGSSKRQVPGNFQSDKQTKKAPGIPEAVGLHTEATCRYP